MLVAVTTASITGPSHEEPLHAPLFFTRHGLTRPPVAAPRAAAQAAPPAPRAAAPGRRGAHDPLRRAPRPAPHRAARRAAPAPGAAGGLLPRPGLRRGDRRRLLRPAGRHAAGRAAHRGRRARPRAV